MLPEEFHVWEGVYESFRDAPKVGLGFDDPIWRSRSMDAAREAHGCVREGRPLDYSMRQRNSVLAVLSATVLAEHPRIRILDFGGGPGFGYLVVTSAIPNAADRVDYHVVDVEGVCVEGTKTFGERRGPSFHTELPDMRFDVVFSASTLQYIEDWRALVGRLAAFGSPYLLFSDVFAGSLESYATVQNYYGSQIPHWILNEDELVREVARAGYALQLKTPCNVKTLGREGDLPMDNFPATRRLKNTTHLMFTRARS